MSLNDQSDQISEDILVHPEPERSLFSLLDLSDLSDSSDLNDLSDSSDSSVGLSIRRSRAHLPLNYTPAAHAAPIQSPFKMINVSPDIS